MEVELHQETCCTVSCGVSFWVDSKYQKLMLKTKASFYCPNGHSMSYTGETDEQKLFRVMREKNELIYERDREIQRLHKEIKKKCRKPRKIKAKQ